MESIAAGSAVLALSEFHKGNLHFKKRARAYVLWSTCIEPVMMYETVCALDNVPIIQSPMLGADVQ